MTAAMISPGWVQMMARYNAWQNRWLIESVGSLPDGEAERDRGAFFGSILGTANHLLWGDEIWLNRLTDFPAPGGGIRKSVTLTPDVAAWMARRKTTDEAIIDWAAGLEDCDGDLGWHSGALGREVTKSKGLLLTHFFNHQTHHRGQLHAMLTAAGGTPGDTDLFIMPEAA